MNKFRGRQHVTIGGEALTLSFSINTIVMIEEQEDTSIGSYVEKMAGFGNIRNMNMTTTRKLVFYALQDSHSDKTLEDINSLLGSEDPNDFVNLVSNCVNALLQALGIGVSAKSNEEVEVRGLGKKKPKSQK